MKQIQRLILSILGCWGLLLSASTHAATTTTGDTLKIGNAVIVSTSDHLGGYPYNSVAGGISNTNNADFYSIIGSGQHNTIPQSLTFNYANTANDHGSTTLYSGASVLAGGEVNYVAQTYTTIGGGTYNSIYPTNMLDSTGPLLPTVGHPTWGGGSAIDVTSSVIAGGSYNLINTPFAAIGGGDHNFIEPSCNYSVVSGGVGNGIGYGSGYSVISGGSENSITNGAWWGTINGGGQNRIAGQLATSNPRVVVTNQTINPVHGGWIGGGLTNVIEGDGAIGAIGGGRANYIESFGGFIGGGEANGIEESSRWSVLAGGKRSVAGMAIRSRMTSPP
jgi:hypothetical protein